MIEQYPQIKIVGTKREQLEVAAKKIGISPDDLSSLIHLFDPTKEKKFESWLIKQLSFGNITFQEKGRVFTLLLDFINLSNKKQIKERDINQYPRIQDLEKEIASIKGIEITEGVSGNLRELLEIEGCSILAQDANWLILRIVDPEAAVKLSSGTKWCTSKLESAKHYLENAKGLYIVFKKTGRHLTKYLMFSGNFSEIGNIQDETIVSLPQSLLALLKEHFLNEFYFVKKFGTAEEIYRHLEQHNPFIGSLDLRGSNVKKIPENFSIEHNFFLTDTEIKYLSKGLSVGGSIYLNGTDVDSLPEDLIVLGAIWGENPKTGKSYQEEYERSSVK